MTLDDAANIIQRNSIANRGNTMGEKSGNVSSTASKVDQASQPRRKFELWHMDVVLLVAVVLLLASFFGVGSKLACNYGKFRRQSMGAAALACWVYFVSTLMCGEGIKLNVLVTRAATLGLMLSFVAYAAIALYSQCYGSPDEVVIEEPRIDHEDAE
jgi:hypothetical protein